MQPGGEDGDGRAPGEWTICADRRRDGKACRAARPGSVYCFGHDPELAERRAAGRAAGGRGRSTVERARKRLPSDMGAMLDRLTDAFDDTKSGQMSPAVARALSTLSGAIVRVYEIAELALRVRDLEAREETEEQGRGTRQGGVGEGRLLSELWRGVDVAGGQIVQIELVRPEHPCHRELFGGDNR